VVNSSMCGLGGGAVWLIHHAGTGAPPALNGSGRRAAGATIGAPPRAGPDERAVRGPPTVTGPGAIPPRGAAPTPDRRRPRPRLFEPAIEYADDGFAAALGWTESVERSAHVFGTASDWARVFRPDGRAPREGERIRLPALGRSLQRIADDGPDVAYRG